MKRLLTIISSGLEVQTVVKQQTEKHSKSNQTSIVTYFENKPASNKAKAIFTRELEKHLSTELRKIKVGESVSYLSDFKNASYFGTVREENNSDNMAKILLKLPPLQETESYVFAQNTYIKFKLADKYETGGTVIIEDVSPWIIEMFSKQ